MTLINIILSQQKLEDLIATAKNPPIRVKHSYLYKTTLNQNTMTLITFNLIQKKTCLYNTSIN